MNKQQYYVTYAQGGPGYEVASLETGHPLFRFESKSEAICKSQELNGWPVDGDEQSYGKQIKDARRLQ